MLVNKQGDLYTVIDSRLGILAHRVPRQSAVVAIYSAIDDDPPIEEVNALLDTHPDAAAWRSEWAAATAVELELLGERIDESEASTVQAKIDTLSEEMQQLRYESIMLEIREAKEQLEDQRIRLVEILADEFSMSFDNAEQEFNVAVIQQLKKTPLWDVAMGRHIV